MNNMKINRQSPSYSSFASERSSSSDSQNLRVYYDGLCHLCSREIDHYKTLEGAEKIEFIDICSPKFDAQKNGLDPKQIHRVMHVQKPDGRFVTRVEAFIEIWKRLPRYRSLAKVARWPGVFQGLEVGYSIFARVRPYLPRKKETCETSPYCEVKNG